MKILFKKLAILPTSLQGWYWIVSYTCLMYSNSCTDTSKKVKGKPVTERNKS